MIGLTRTIGVAGAQGHIGATTQALQIVQHLQLMGNRVCYLEMNNNQYIEAVLNTYDVAEKEKGHIIFSGKQPIEFYDMKFVRQLAKQDYDYIVKDYGTYDSNSFNAASFLEQNIKLFVCGIKPNEIMKTYEILNNPEFEDVSFMLSFIDNATEIRQEVRSLFDSVDKKSRRSNKVYFADYAPEPFEYTGVSNKTYADLIRGEENGQA